MAITVTRKSQQGKLESVETVFEGRVLELANTREQRNWSDTYDYTDYRTTECTYALVWLGTHNLPPRAPNVTSKGVSRPSCYYKVASFEEKDVRDLEFHEQFAWVDCTNLFSWRGDPSLKPEVDTAMAEGDPLMWANYIAWKGYMKGLEDKSLRMAVEEEKAKVEKAEKEAKAKAVKEAKKEKQKQEVEAAMLLTPEKNTEVTINGFTGRVFWKGVKEYRGKWRGTVGVKNNYGEVVWVDVSHWVSGVK